jgi:hypothetical protein
MRMHAWQRPGADANADGSCTAVHAIAVPEVQWCAECALRLVCLCAKSVRYGWCACVCRADCSTAALLLWHHEKFSR